MNADTASVIDLHAKGCQGITACNLQNNCNAMVHYNTLDRMGFGVQEKHKHQCQWYKQTPHSQPLAVPNQ